MANIRIELIKPEQDFLNGCQASGFDKAKEVWISNYLESQLTDAQKQNETVKAQFVKIANKEFAGFLSGIREVNNAQRDLISVKRTPKEKKA